VLQLEVLIFEPVKGEGIESGNKDKTHKHSLKQHALVSVDALSTSSVASSEVTSLQHELGNDSVEGRTFVSESRSTSAQLSEVLGGLGDNAKGEGEKSSISFNESLSSSLRATFFQLTRRRVGR
jgi:hypothetical protein